MKKLKLLLVDDEEEFVETLADRLRLRDLDSTIACNGKEALSLVGQEAPDVVVLDLKMPGIDGIDVLERIKEIAPDTQVIILTGHGSKKDEDAARRLGAFDYVKKPTDIDSLVSRIRNAFVQRMKKLEKTFMAAAFAEQGDFDSAKHVLEEKEPENKKKR